MTLIYRVAHTNAKWMLSGVPLGPYGHGTAAIKGMGEAHRNGQHPSPYYDGIGNFSDDYFCAFESVAALRVWFKGWIRVLHENGYRIYVYSINERHIQHGRHQVVAKLRFGREVGCYSLFTRKALP